MRLVAALAATFGLSACAHARSLPVAGPGSIDYTLTVPAKGSWILDVEVQMAGARSDRLVLPEGEIGASSVSLVVDGAPRPLPRQGDAWIAPSCRDRCTLRYEVDVLAVAQGCRRLDCMHRVGDAVVGMASVWMLRPEPMGDPSVHVELRGGDPSRFATGLRRDPRGGYTMRGRRLARRRTPASATCGARVCSSPAAASTWRSSATR